MATTLVLVLAMALAMTLAMAMAVKTFLPAGAGKAGKDGKGEKLAEEGLALLSLSPSLPTLAAANQL